MHHKSGTMFTGINITPLTDVFLVLLVVMLLVPPAEDHTGILKIDPPSLCACPYHHPAQIHILVSKHGQVKINEQLIKSATLTSIMAALQAEQRKLGRKNVLTVVLSEPDAAQKDVVAVMDAACGMGIAELRFGLSQSTI